MNDTVYFCLKTSDKIASAKLIKFLDGLKVEPGSTKLMFADSLEGVIALLEGSKNDTQLSQVQQDV